MVLEDTLFISLGNPDDEQALWFVTNERGTSTTGVTMGPLVDAATLTDGRPVVALIAHPTITRTFTDLPVRGAKLAAALPYALEEQFAGDVDELHFCVGSADANRMMPVAALDHGVMQRYMDRLQLAGIAPSAIYSLHDALPSLDGYTQLLADHNISILKSEDGSVSALSQLPPSTLLAAWAAGTQTTDLAESTTKHLRIYISAGAKEHYADDWDQVREQFPDADFKYLDDDVAVFAARTIVTQGGINLLQGRYSVSGNRMKSIRPWIPVAAMLAIAFIASLAARYTDMRDLQQEVAALDQQIAGLLQDQGQSEPDPQRAEAALSGIVRKNGGSTSTDNPNDSDGPAYLPTLKVVAAALNGDDNTQIDAVSYRSGIFDIRLSTKSTDALEKLRRTIIEGGSLEAQIQRTEQQDGQVKSFLQIKGASQ